VKSRRIRRLFFDRRGVNVVISNVILASAVIALGFAVQYWAYQRSLDFNMDYAEVVEEDIAHIKEKLVIEYIFYNTSKKELAVYLINCGKNDNVSLASVYLSSNSWSQSFSVIELKFLNGTSTDSLDVGEEGYLKLSADLTPLYQIYSIRIITGRERWFVKTFIP